MFYEAKTPKKKKKQNPRLLADNQEASGERFIASLRPQFLWHNYVSQTRKRPRH